MRQQTNFIRPRLGRRSACAIFTLLFVLVATSPSDGSISFYRLGKRLFHDQTNDSQPTMPVFMDAGVDLLASDPNDLASARVFSTKPSLLSPASPFVLTEYTPGGWISSQAYPSVEAMDVNIPPGDVFGFLIEDGNLGSRLALLPVPATNLFPTNVPYFTGNAYSQLNGLDTTQPFTFTWNNFTAPLGANETPQFFNLYRVSNGQSVVNTFVPFGTTSYNLPANSLLPGVQYGAQIVFSSRKVTLDAGFIDGDLAALYDSSTTLSFVTASSGGGASAFSNPEPTAMTLALITLFVSGFYPRRRLSRSAAFTIVIVSLTAVAPSANAAIDFYRVGKTIVHLQTSDAPPPTTPSLVYGGPDLLTPLPADIVSARVFSTTTSPPSPVPEFVLNEFFPGYWGSSSGYSSVAEMDVALPPGDVFGYLIEGGDLGDQLALLPLPAANLFATTRPQFLNNAYSQLNGLDPAQSITVSWNSFVPAAGVNAAPIFFNVFRVSDGQQIVGGVFPTSLTSFQIPANSLAPNTAYRASLDFSSRLDELSAGFENATSSALFDSLTELNFTTGQQTEGDYNRDGTVNAADYVLWRKTLGQLDVVPYSGADGDGDGDILEGDYTVWRTRFGGTSGGSGASGIPAPEATTVTLALLGLMAIAVIDRRRTGS
jgi:hypothetical protein